MTDVQPTVASGQIWQEHDPRHPRYVLVASAGSDRVSIVTCDENGIVTGTRQTYAKLARFNGKRTGYRFIKEKQP